MQSARRVSGFSERAKDLAAWIELENPVIAPVDHPNMLVRGDKQALRVADAGPLLQKIPVRIKNLDPFVFSIPHIHVAVAVHRDAVRKIEFTRAGTVFSPSFQELSFAIKLYDPRVAVAA